ncbi:hypothetical protein EV702DRAFT_195781 [Suillus placidus]|uniref:Uncharacterized protein n=1 Tax=Suillus placidus TaxID=48579 RepID=A0A9P7CUT6_9AGAM|nr:hypothetical protein EV702DRAFT_195781 [Suillus placidus]
MLGGRDRWFCLRVCFSPTLPCIRDTPLLTVPHFLTKSLLQATNENSDRRQMGSNQTKGQASVLGPTDIQSLVAPSQDALGHSARSASGSQSYDSRIVMAMEHRHVVEKYKIFDERPFTVVPRSNGGLLNMRDLRADTYPVVGRIRLGKKTRV